MNAHQVTNMQTASVLTSAERLAQQVSEGTAIAALREADYLRKQLEGLIADIVRDAKDNGETWETIADALDVSRQAAHQRYQTQSIHEVSKHQAKTVRTTIATLNEDLNDELTPCRACGRQTLGLVQVSLGDVWIGTSPLCDECQLTAEG